MYQEKFQYLFVFSLLKITKILNIYDQINQYILRYYYYSIKKNKKLFSIQKTELKHQILYDQLYNNFAMNCLKNESNAQHSQQDSDLYMLTPQKRLLNKVKRQQTTHNKQFKSSNKRFRKCIWTKDEDQLLKEKVNERGALHWAEIAKFLINRTGKQCRQRWHNHLREGVTKQAWDMHQYWILALCVRAYGKRWSTISQRMPGRSDNTIKNQWNCKMKPYKTQFDNKIQHLLKNPQSWDSLSSEQQQLLYQISETNQQVKQQNQLLIDLESYQNLLEQGLLEYYEAKRQLTLNVNQKIQYLEMPGDLSDVISAGDCMFYSDQENPILPINLFRKY